jgi:3-oxoadipate enol-lactonase
MPTVAAKDGVQLHYAVHDYTDPWRTTPVLLLQHGFGRSGKFWFNLIPYLSRFYRVVCPDMRGLGQSSRDFDLATGINVENYLSDLLTIADAVGADRFHYAGESLGGILGMGLAATSPDRVRTLTLLSAPLRINETTQRTFAFEFPSWQDALRELGAAGWAAKVNMATRFPPGTDQGLLDWFAAEMGNSSTDTMIAMSRLAARVEAVPFLEKIQAPVLGLYPSKGRFTTSGQEDEMKGRIKNLRLVHMPNAFHMIWVLDPAGCAGHMLHFMAAHDGTTCHE